MTERGENNVNHNVSVVEEDKELLRRRLELLQREYERTALRLQRAERRDAVRRHVRCRISECNHSGLSQTEASPLESNHRKKPACQSTQGGSAAPTASPAPSSSVGSLQTRVALGSPQRRLSSGSAGSLQTRASSSSVVSPHTRVPPSSVGSPHSRVPSGSLGSPHTRVPSSSVGSPHSRVPSGSLGSPHTRVPSSSVGSPHTRVPSGSVGHPQTRVLSVRFHLPTLDPALSPKFSPAHRLRSKRSRLRLAERERDTESSQERERDRESSQERERDRESSQEKERDRESSQEKERDRESSEEKEGERDEKKRQEKDRERHGKENREKDGVSCCDKERECDGERRCGKEGERDEDSSMENERRMDGGRNHGAPLSCEPEGLSIAINQSEGSPSTDQSLPKRLTGRPASDQSLQRNLTGSPASDQSLRRNLTGSPASDQSLQRRLSTKPRRPAEKVDESEPVVAPTHHPLDQSQPVASPAHHPVDQSEPLVMPTHHHPLDQSQPVASPVHHPVDQSEPLVMPTHHHPVDQLQPVASPAHYSLDQSGPRVSPVHHPVALSESVVAPSQDAVTASSQSSGPSGKEEVIGGTISQWESSCTLVEGLLFPVEYYVRTTRRMANSQSPLDLQAVILSQLSRGRAKRRASQPRSSATPTVVRMTSQPIKPDYPSQDSALQRDSKPIRDEDSVLQMDSKPFRTEDSSLQKDSKPIKARRRRRGGGWGRRQKRSRIPSPSWSNEQAASDTESRPPPEETDTSHSQTHPQAHSEPITTQDPIETCPQHQSEPVTAQDCTVARPQTDSEPITAQDLTIACPQHQSEPITALDQVETHLENNHEPIIAQDHTVTRPQDQSEPVTAQDHVETHLQHQSEPITIAHGNVESQQKLLLLPEVYPIFRRGCGQKRKHAQTDKEVSPLLPSLSPLLREEGLGSLRSLLQTFELQDFHLPDDEYGHLKLQKLRPLAMEVEPYSPQNCGLNTCRSKRRRRNKAPGNSMCPSVRGGGPPFGTHTGDCDWLSPDPLLLSPTPTGREVLGEVDQWAAQIEPVAGLTDAKNQSDTTGQVDGKSRGGGWTSDQSERQGHPITDQWDESLAGSRLDQTDGVTQSEKHNGLDTHTETQNSSDTHTLAGEQTHTSTDTHTETHNGLDTHTETHNSLDTHTETHNGLDTHTLAGEQTHTPTDTHTETHTLADKSRDTHTSAHTQKSSDIHTETHTQMEKHTHTLTDTHNTLDTRALSDTHTSTDTHMLEDTHTKTRSHTHSCTLADSPHLSSSSTHAQTDTQAHTNARQPREEHTHTHTHTLLNLSLSLTSRTQRGHDLDLPSLGPTPFSPPRPPTARALFRSQRSPSVYPCLSPSVYPCLSPSVTSCLNPSPSQQPASDWATETRSQNQRTNNAEKNQRTIGTNMEGNQRTVGTNMEGNQRTVGTNMEGNQRTIGTNAEKKQKTVVSSQNENPIMLGTITEGNQMIPGTVADENLFGTWEDENHVIVTEENCKGTFTEKSGKGPNTEENLKGAGTVLKQKPSGASATIASPFADHTLEPSPSDSQLVDGAPDSSPSDSLLVEGVIDSSPSDSLLVDGAPEHSLLVDGAPEHSLTDSLLVEGAHGSSPTDSLLVDHAKEPSQKDMSLAHHHSPTPADCSLVEAVPDPASSTVLEDGTSVLHLKHTLKGAVEGCVYDVCVARSLTGALRVCVAGEWSVCVWTEDTPFHWTLLHTWRFTQSVVSLFSIPDSDGLLCVTLGQLEITEARVLSTGCLSERLVYEGVCLRSVVGVSSCRIACCHTSKYRQVLEVHTLTKEGSTNELIRLVSTDYCIESLVAMENQSDALIGWTDSSALVIWNMRTGHLLQTIELGHMVSTATCLRGYSCNGMVCVLLQSVCMSEEKSECVFTLVGLNPINRKTAQLTTVNTHSNERFVECDVIGSAVVGVSPSSRMVLCDMSRGGACLLVGGVINDCHLARWAGLNTFLTGQKNGDVCVYQYTPV